MTFKSKLESWFRTDWLPALLILIVFLCVKGYRYGWDDQHLELPLLKSLIDPTLYEGDYIVESLKPNFVTFLYPLLARLITIDQIPTIYLILYFISRYFLFLGMYKLWRHISGKRTTALFCIMTFLFLGRVQEFFYKTFSHQEFALAFIFVGIYLFYKERFVLAAALLGVAMNFHILYSLFPMTYMSVYLLWQRRQHGINVLGKALVVFMVFSLPILIWVIKKIHIAPLMNPVGPAEIAWMILYQMSVPHNFIFDGVMFTSLLAEPLIWLKGYQRYLFLVSLFLLNFFFNEPFRKDKKAQAIGLSVFLFLAISYIFTYFKPLRLIIDLNLIRNVQFLFFILIGYTTILVLKILEEKNLALGYFACVMFGFFAFNDLIALCSTVFLICLLAFERLSGKQKTRFATIWKIVVVVCLVTSFFLICKLFSVTTQQWPDIFVFLMVILVPAFFYFFISYRPPQKYLFHLKRSFLIAPIAALFLYSLYYHIYFSTLETQGPGGWQFQREWEEIQRFARNHTPKDALFLIPVDTPVGGFRIFSERKIICCERDRGIIGFDYNAALEWYRRNKEVGAFKIILDAPIEPAIQRAILKYKVNYIVFMRYYEPPTDFHPIYEKVYQNNFFSLYKIHVNPVKNPA